MKTKKHARIVTWMLTLTMITNLINLPVHAAVEEKREKSGNLVSRVAYDDERYARSAVLEVKGEPFWYNGIQIRIDKLRDDQKYAFNDNTMQQLFDQVKKDGFTTAACQIRWSDIQPNHTLYAADTSYVYGGKNADTSYKGNEGTWIQYDKNDESKQGLGYLKFNLGGKEPNEIDGAKIRLFNRNSLAAPRKIEVYAIENDSWNGENLTWNNAPGHEGYNVTGTLVAESPEFDRVKNYGYYDLDITEFIQNSEWAVDGTVSFIIREGSGSNNDPNTKLVFGGFDDDDMTYDGIKIDARPQIIYSDADEFDFTYLDQAIDFAKNADLKFEVLWFGLDTVNFSSDLRVPSFVYSNYRMGQHADGTPFAKRDGLTSTTGKYRYFMCKNDDDLVAAEAKAIKEVFDHIAGRGDDVVIGCQLSNEPGVGWGGSQHCMCSVCIERKATQNTEDFKTTTLWDYNNKLGKAVKESAYSVWTRVNLIQGYSTQIVKMNEEKKKTNESYIDYIGVDLYVTPPSGLALLGIQGQPFAWETNLPMVMELGQKDDRANGLYLEEDLLATLSGGAYSNIYDAISGDGCQIYSYDKNTGSFYPYKASNEKGDEAVVSALFRTNHMLNKIGYDLAVKAPGEVGKNKLVYFNAASDSQGKLYEKNRVIGGNKSITFTSEANAVGIVVDKGENEAAFLSTRDNSFAINNLRSLENIISAELGHYNEADVWVKEADFVISEKMEYKDGKVVFEVPQYECLRLTFEEGVWGEAEELLELRIEAEADYDVTAGVGSEAWDDGASGGQWVKVLSSKIGDAITINASIPQTGFYELNTCYRSGNSRGSVQLTVDGNVVGSPIDMYHSSSKFYSTDPEGEIYLTQGDHKFVYSVVGKNSSSAGYGMGLDYIYLTQTEKVVDSSALRAVYEELKKTEQENYTKETWTTFQNELENTRKLLEKENPSQSELDNQKAILQSAFEGLLEDTDRSKEEIVEELRGLLTEAKEEVKKSEQYPKTAIEKFKIEIETMENLIDSPEIGSTGPECLKRLKAFRNVYKEFLDAAYTMALWTDEDFESTSGDFGFVTDAKSSGGRLFITNEMANEATSVKTFEPEIMGQSEVNVSFDWTSELTENKGKSGIEFRDSYGRLVFSLLGCYNQNGSGTKRELRYSVTAEDSDSSAAKYICEPKWTKVEKALEPQSTYHVEFHADFNDQLLDVTITDDEGIVVVDEERLKIKGLNLAKMVACNYWSVEPAGKRYPSSQTIDNFKLFVSNDANEFILKDRMVYAFGDSLVSGHKYKYGFADYIAMAEGMKLKKYALNGATMMNAPGYDGQILTQVNNAPDAQPDFIIFGGGVNDAEYLAGHTDPEYGSVSDSKDPESFELDTFAGDFEQTVYKMKDKWPDAQIVYVVAHKSGAWDWETQKKMHELTMDICIKWEIAVADVFEDSELDTREEEFKNRYTFNDVGGNGLPGTNGSGIYPNLAALEVFYVPLISDTLKDPEPCRADKKELYELITFAEEEVEKSDIYSVEDIYRLKHIIVESKKVADDETATQSKVNNQAKILKEAIAELQQTEASYYTTGIKVVQKPDKMMYEVGAEFDTEGMKVIAYETASASNASPREQELSEGDYDVFYDFETPGSAEVVVSYFGLNSLGIEEEFTDSFEVCVWEDFISQYYTTSIEVTRKPDKTKYKVDEDFDPTGMTVVAYQIATASNASPSNATSIQKVLTEDEYELDYDFKQTGTRKVTVSYENKTAMFEVEVIRRRSSSGNGAGNNTQKVVSGPTTAVIMDGLNPTIYLTEGMSAGSWKKDSKGWWFDLAKGGYLENQWAQIDGKWYIFDKNGYMLSGWIQNAKTWYMLREDGSMYEDTWVMSGGKWYHFRDDGSMRRNEWFEYNGYWYYQGNDGAMMSGGKTPDGYLLDQQGRWIS